MIRHIELDPASGDVFFSTLTDIYRVPASSGEPTLVAARPDDAQPIYGGFAVHDSRILLPASSGFSDVADRSGVFGTIVAPMVHWADARADRERGIGRALSVRDVPHGDVHRCAGGAGRMDFSIWVTAPLRVAQPLFGRVADARGYSFSYLVLAVVQLSTLPFLLLARRSKAPSDPIASGDEV